MISLFGFRESGRRARPQARAGYAEAPPARRVTLLPGVQVPIGSATPASEENSDTSAFLARVYLHQQC